MIRPFSGFKCSDGRTFESRAEAEAWERSARLAGQLSGIGDLELREEVIRDWLWKNWATIKAGVTQTLEERAQEEK